MSAADTARLAYDAARQEILLRMRLRDQALLVYLALVGTIFGVSLSNQDEGGEYILMTIPYIALGVAIIVSQHNVLPRKDSFGGLVCCVSFLHC